MRRFLSVLLFCCIANLGANAQEAVHFFQFTDAHLFDDGYTLPREEAFKVAAEDRRAFRWAIAAMNQQPAVDFAIFTGDLGLQNVDFAQSRCAAIPVPFAASGVPPFRLDAAVDELATLLAPLKVPRLYFIAGNNDVITERISDGGRFTCFMALLQEKMRAKNAAEVYPLLIKNAFVIRGIRFAGLDTVSIKTRENYTAACSISPEPINCPMEQINLLGDMVDASAQPVVVFTHSPDLLDPFRKQPVWDIDDKMRAEWEDTACKAKVLGIFAGHLHDDKKTTYGGVDSDLQVKLCVAAKTRVAPPLAERYQYTGAQARGFIRASVSTSGIQDVSVSWYDTNTVVPTAK